MPAGQDEFPELHKAAGALGVHYQTAYRPVRSGKLPAQLISKRYPVSRHDLDTIESVFSPLFRHIGQQWHDGDLPIWVVHRASAIVERTLGDLVPNPQGGGRGTAMAAAVARDVHKLADGTAELIRAAGTPTIVGGPGRSLEQPVDEAARCTRTDRHL